MQTITIYPSSEKQKSYLQNLFQDLNLKFEVKEFVDDSKYTQDEFFAKIDKSIEQAESGKTFKLDPKSQKEFLGL
jgi:hypothetical protein